MEKQEKLRECLANLVSEAHERLRTHQPAFDYLTVGRGLTVDTIKREKIGYCDVKIVNNFMSSLPPDTWEITDYGYFIKKMSKCILVPIRRPSGVIVAFSTRSIDPSVKGWWNSPFRKESYLYGMDTAHAAVSAENKAYLFEGYVDRLFLKQSGLENSVSPMGTNLTKLQAGIIFRYCDRLCVCFDTDPVRNGKEGGGQRSLRKLVETYNVEGEFSSISAIVLPPKNDGTAYDPDEYVRQYGLKAFLSLERECKRERADKHVFSQSPFRNASL